MHKDRKLQALRVSLGHEELRKGDEVVFFCLKPECSRRKPKLSVNLETDNFHCWVCGFSGKSLFPLLAKGNDRAEYARDRETDRPKEKVVQYDSVKLPKEFLTLSKDQRSPCYNASISYLKQRGITKHDILKWKLGFCEDGEYKNRIIIPSFDEFGELNFWVGRSVYGAEPRYKHGNFCKDIIFNDYLIDWRKDVVITEGPFDAMKAGDNAIALQGSILNEGSRLFDKLVVADVNVFFAMDDDALKKQDDIMLKLIAYDVKCLYVPLKGKKDVGEMSNDEFMRLKRDAVLCTSNMDILKRRVLEA